jgi:hypothetical protein
VGQPGGGGQANLYVYVGNDPVNFVDPDGHILVLVGGVIGGLAGAAGAALTGGDVIAGAAGGAATGALAGLTGGMTLGAQLAAGVGAGLAGLSVNQAVRVLTGSNPVGPQDIIAALTTGLAGPVAGTAFRELASPGLSGVSQFAMRRVAGGISSAGISAEAKSICGNE